MSLNVLVLESDSTAADAATRELRAAGHTVLKCHDEGSPAFPCIGLADTTACPLRAHEVDVALVVRSAARTQPTLREDGARSALTHCIPVVVAGARVLSPYDDFAARKMDRTTGVVDVCEEAAAAPIAGLSDRATAVVHEMFAPDDQRANAAVVVVTRVMGGLRARIVGVGALSAQERSSVAVRVLATLRRLDQFARGIDVVFDPASPEAGDHSST